MARSERFELLTLRFEVFYAMNNINDLATLRLWHRRPLFGYRGYFMRRYSASRK